VKSVGVWRSFCSRPLPYETEVLLCSAASGVALQHTVQKNGRENGRGGERREDNYRLQLTV